MEQNIHTELAEINQKLDVIIELLKSSKQGSDKMVNHIDFVESIYTAVRAPLNTMIKYVNGTNDRKQLLPPK